MKKLTADQAKVWHDEMPSKISWPRQADGAGMPVSEAAEGIKKTFLATGVIR